MEDSKNLETVRDEKVFPIVQRLLKEISTDLIGSKDEQKGLTLKVLSLMLASDLNVSSEVSYVPQLILKVFANINETLQSCTLIETDDARYNSILSKMLTIVSDAGIKFGNLTPDEVKVDFAPIKEKFNELFLAEKLTKIEMDYMIKNMFESFNVFNNLLSRSIESATEKMECKILGISTMSDLSLKRLDEVLKQK